MPSEAIEGTISKPSLPISEKNTNVEQSKMTNKYDSIFAPQTPGTAGVATPSPGLEAQHSLCELAVASRKAQAFLIHYKKRELEANTISRQAWQEPFEGLYMVDKVTSASAPEQSAGFST